MSTIDTLKSLIHEQFDIDPGSIDEQAPFDSYNLDSLTLAELIFAIEDKFRLDIPELPTGDIKTLAQLAALVDRLLAEQGAEAKN